MPIKPSLCMPPAPRPSDRQSAMSLLSACRGYFKLWESAHNANSTIFPISEGAVQSCGGHSWHWAADSRVAEWIPPHVGAPGHPRPLPSRTRPALSRHPPVWFLSSEFGTLT